jgi:glucose-6-phosphate 1-dehydrogenase
LHGDPSLFTRSDEIELSWKIVDPILKGWASGQGPALEVYPRGAEGPAAADELLEREGRSWKRGCGRH